jgi:pyruvate dehydrogenase E2 component (dihydrolipoamide acetyltransferase)
MTEVFLDKAVEARIESAELRKGRSGVSIPLTRIQKLIGERMLRSKQTKPCFYIESKADVTELMGLRSKLSKSLGVKITSSAFLIRAAALAAKEYPLMTATVEGRDCGDNVRVADAINVGFAVNAPQGLVVPVVKHADRRTLGEIARAEKLLTEKARSNTLTLEEMEGETIALSNLGAYGIDSFLGIVPPPASTILAVGNVVNTVTPQGGEPAVRKTTSLTLAVDHRIISSAYAAKFLSFIGQQLGKPQQLL